jgi:hypothetical protein
VTIEVDVGIGKSFVPIVDRFSVEVGAIIITVVVKTVVVMYVVSGAGAGVALLVPTVIPTKTAATVVPRTRNVPKRMNRAFLDRQGTRL